MEMKVPYHVKGKERRELAQAISDVLNTVPCYQGLPTYAYAIGECVLDRDGTLLIGSEVESETVQRLLAYLAEHGFVGKVEESVAQMYSGFVVSMPKAGFTDKALDNLRRLVQSKGDLFSRAFGADVSQPMVDEEAVSFPWFPMTTEPAEINAYTQFVAKMCELAQALRRAKSQTVETDNDKYAFRCFLLRLGFIGDEYKAARKILLRNLAGDGAFRRKK